MWNRFYLWRFYTFGREQYQECMNHLFLSNLLSLRKASFMTAVGVGLSSIYPMLIENNIVKMGIYLAVAIIALLVFLYSYYKTQTALISTRSIYVAITIFYANIMLFGIYLGVWANPDGYAAIFLCFLVVALLMFMNPPLFNFFLTLGAAITFITSAIIAKTPEVWITDTVNVIIASAISLYFNWQISKLRMGSEISENMLEHERNKYLDQSIIDELTQLRNRRDFMQTFERYVHNYRTTDAWLCIALSDIDFFKKYNDRYGHPKGDDCLRAVGGVINGLKESHGIYSARIGGEEFALLWFEKDITSVDAVVTHLMGSIGDLKIPHEDSKVSPYVSMSIGVYIEKCGASSDTKPLYDLTDKALYTAKARGRNCAIIYGKDLKQRKVEAPPAAP